MDNYRNSVSIELDRPRWIRFDVNALADAEEALGGAAIGEVMQKGAGIRHIRALLWAGLRADDPKLTIERVGLLLEDHLAKGGDMADIGDAIGKAFEKSGIYKSASKEAGSAPNE